MHVIACAQRSPAWREARLGKLTGSRAASMRSPHGRLTLLHALVRERITGRSHERHFSNAHMARGIQHEPTGGRRLRSGDGRAGRARRVPRPRQPAGRLLARRTGRRRRAARGEVSLPAHPLRPSAADYARVVDHRAGVGRPSSPSILTSGRGCACRSRGSMRATSTWWRMTATCGGSSRTWTRPTCACRRCNPARDPSSGPDCLDQLTDPPPAANCDIVFGATRRAQVCQSDEEILNTHKQWKARRGR